MAIARRRGGPRGEDYGGRDRGGGKHEHEREPWDDPREHREIEKRRFAGGLPPTPQLYALAREQWYRLPGAAPRHPLDLAIGAPASGEPPPPELALPGGKESAP
jgi:hypothetical protein